MSKSICFAAASLAAFLLAIPATAGAGPTGLKVIDHLKAGGEGGWDYAAFDAVKRQLYVTRGTSVMAVDADSGRARLNVAVANRGHQALAVNGGSELLITNGGDATATIVDAATGKVRATVKTSAGPDAAVLDPFTGLVMVMGNKSGDVNLIDVKSATAAGTIAVGGQLEFAASDGRGRAYVNVEDKGEIAVLDMRRKTVSARYRMEGCDEPSGLAYIAPERLLLAACANGVAKVVAADTGTTVATLKIGPRPDAAFYDDARRLAYIPSGGDGTLAVIAFKGRTAQVIDSVQTARGVRTGAIDPRTGKIFLPSAKFGPPAQAGGRPTMVPDSFEVLVVGK